MHSNENDSLRPRMKRPYTTPRLEKLTPAEANEKLAKALPEAPPFQHFIRHLIDVEDPIDKN
jgi:hypothetical protein